MEPHGAGPGGPGLSARLPPSPNPASQRPTPALGSGLPTVSRRSKVSRKLPSQHLASHTALPRPPGLQPGHSLCWPSRAVRPGLASPSDAALRPHPWACPMQQTECAPGPAVVALCRPTRATVSGWQQCRCPGRPLPYCSGQQQLHCPANGGSRGSLSRANTNSEGYGRAPALGPEQGQLSCAC